MKTCLIKSLLGFVVIVSGFGLVAQEKKENVKVQITKEVDGELKTYEKEYSSESEMRADEELQEFMADRQQLPFWYADEDSAIVHLDSLGKRRSYSFSFNADEELQHLKVLHPTDSNWRELERHMRALSKGLSDMNMRVSEGNGIAFSFGGEDFNFNFNLPDSLSEQIRAQLKDLRMQERALMEHLKVRVIKKVKISDSVEEFGKKGSVKENEQLVLEGLSYHPNPSSNGRFRLKFNTPEEGELTIKIYNLDGKVIFNRYFERYSGLFSETIDLSSQQAGIYLLEVQLEDKRLTRKVAID